jgi:predicted membrane metal-binding protein
MHDVHYYLYEIWDFLREGFRDGFAHVNAILGLIIALVAAYLLPSWKRLWAVALGATVIHLIAEVMLPVLADHQSFRLPPDMVEMSYWRSALALYLGYLVVIAIFFFIKRRVLPGGGGRH